MLALLCIAVFVAKARCLAEWAGSGLNLSSISSFIRSIVRSSFDYLFWNLLLVVHVCYGDLAYARCVFRDPFFVTCHPPIVGGASP